MLRRMLSIWRLLLSASLMISSTLTIAATINVTTQLDLLNNQALASRCLEKDIKDLKDRWSQVGNLKDKGSPDRSTCSLREAVQLANQSPDTDIIKIPAGVYKLTIFSDKDSDDENQGGDLDLWTSIIFQGEGATKTIIDAEFNSRIIHHHKGILKINKLTLQHGKDIDLLGRGGAIESSNGCNCKVEINDSIIQENEGYSAAIEFTRGYDQTRGRLIIRNSIIKNNHSMVAEYPTAAIRYRGHSFLMEDSVFQSNYGGLNVSANKSRVTGMQFIKSASYLNHKDRFTSLFVCREANAKIEISNSVFKDNVSESSGSILLAVENDDTCTVNIDQTIFQHNEFGSAIHAHVPVDWIGSGSLRVSLTNSVIADNKIQADYPVITLTNDTGSIEHDFYLENVAIINNDASESPVGVLNASGFDGVTLVNTTISGNKAEQNMILATDNSQIALLHTTLANNEVQLASTHGSLRAEVGASIEIANTILADALNCYDENNNINSLNRNISTDHSCLLDQGQDMVGTDPRLAPLADNGGDTFTHALLPTSPAIDAADDVIVYDQRGFLRPSGTAADIGAYEAHQ